MWKLPATFALFPVLSPQVHPDVIKVFLPPLSTFDGAHMRKNTAQLQCSHSRAGDPGNEARRYPGTVCSAVRKSLHDL